MSDKTDIKEAQQREEWKQQTATCIHCGSENIDYIGGTDFDGDCCYFKYICRDCKDIGCEVYAMAFIENQEL